MIQGINWERFYQDEYNRDNNLIISFFFYYLWFQFFILVLYFFVLCFVLGMILLIYISDVFIFWRFEKFVLKKNFDIIGIIIYNI